MMVTKYYVDSEYNYLGGFDEGSPDIPNGAIEVTPRLDPDKIWNGSEWADDKAGLYLHLANYRYEKEIGGMPYGGMNLPTDDRSKMLINGAYNKAIQENDPQLVKTFKINGTFIQLTNQNIIDIALAIAGHVQLCFDCEGVVSAMIDSDALTSKEGVEVAFDQEYG